MSSASLFVWMALEFVEFDAVEFLEAFAAVLARVVEMSFRSVFSHVPVQRRSLSTLIPTDLTSVDTHKKCYYIKHSDTRTQIQCYFLKDSWSQMKSPHIHKQGSIACSHFTERATPKCTATR